MTPLAAFEEVIDASGIPPRIEALLPIGRSSQIACSAGEGSPSGWSLPSAPATRPKVYSACRQVSWCGPCFQSAMTPSRA